MHGTDVLRDVLTRFAIATGGGLHQHAMLIAQVDRQPVKFQFGCIFDRRIVLAQSQFLAHPRVECLRAARFGIGLGTDREHRYCMAYLGKGIERLATDTPGGRIGCDEFGMLIFERLQLTEQPVIFRIGNGRLIKDVVGIIMTLDLPAQRCRARQHIGRRHQENRRSDRRDPDGTPRASMRS